MADSRILMDTLAMLQQLGVIRRQQIERWQIDRIDQNRAIRPPAVGTNRTRPA